MCDHKTWKTIIYSRNGHLTISMGADAQKENHFALKREKEKEWKKKCERRTWEYK